MAAAKVMTGGLARCMCWSWRRLGSRGTRQAGHAEAYMESRRLQLELLAQAGRLLLEYNASSGEIRRALTTTARR